MSAATEIFPDVCPEDAVGCDCSWHENARQASAHNAALDEQDRQSETAKERAKQKRARRAARGPGFAGVRPPVPTKRTPKPQGFPDVSTDPAVGLALAASLVAGKKWHRSTGYSAPARGKGAQ